MEQARISSARISASFVFPKLVRSPHSTRTSAALEISVNSSRYGATMSSITWRSPMAAMRNLGSVVSGILLFEVADRVGKSPLIDVDRIIARAEDPAAAHLFPRSLNVCLVMETFEKLFHEPSRDAVSLA